MGLMILMRSPDAGIHPRQDAFSTLFQHAEGMLSLYEVRPAESAMIERHKRAEEADQGQAP
jgi:hypothetical protein